MRERRAPPTFDILVEIQGWNEVVVHEDVADVVDRMLRGNPISPQLRTVDELGRLQRSHAETKVPALFNNNNGDRGDRGYRGGRDRRDTPRRAWASPMPDEQIDAVPLKSVSILPYGINKGKLMQAVRSINAPVELVADLGKADMLLTTKNYYRRSTQALQLAEQRGKPVYVLRKNTLAQIQQFVQALTRKQSQDAQMQLEHSDAIDEAERGGGAAGRRRDAGEAQPAGGVRAAPAAQDCERARRIFVERRARAEPPCGDVQAVGGMAVFISFEGGEGSGKSTQAELLTERLRGQRAWRGVRA